MPLATDTAFAGYTVLRLLGSGGMGEVYLAHHPRLPRQDALKVLRPDISADSDYRERFAREAELAGKLWHPNIVSIHDRGEDEGRLWISMDYVDGTDAGRLLRDEYPTGMPLSAVIEIATAVASALDYAHARGLLHRDVKPSNILVAELGDGERRILLSDFGIARDLGDSSGLTVTNATVGTVAYAAPEQLLGMPLDGKADQYALAASAYHLLNGAPLFPDSNAAVVIGKHLNSPPPALANRHPELAQLDPVLDKALAKNPKDRFGSCTEFARALGNATAMPPPITYPTLPHPAAAPAPKRWPSLLAIAAFAVAVCVAAYLVIKVINRPAPSFALTGTVHLNGDSMTSMGLPSGYRCAGAQNYDDVAPGASVTVADEAGKLLAKGSFEHSYLVRGTCNMSFRVNAVLSGADFYRVQVARQDEFTFTESEAKAGVDITLGSSEPTATTSPPTTALPTTTTRPSTTASATPNREQVALARLRATAAHDRSFVPVERWVAQLSSKRPGTQDDGIVYDYSAIWDHYLRFRQHYAQRNIDLALLWSGDWSTFDGRDYWVIVTAGTFPTADDALAWCSSEGYPWDDCFAKLVSTKHPVEGSTRYNPH